MRKNYDDMSIEELEKAIPELNSKEQKRMDWRASHLWTKNNEKNV